MCVWGNSSTGEGGREGVGAGVICGGTRVKQAWKVERGNLLFCVITT